MRTSATSSPRCQLALPSSQRSAWASGCCSRCPRPPRPRPSRTRRRSAMPPTRASTNRALARPAARSRETSGRVIVAAPRAAAAGSGCARPSIRPPGPARTQTVGAPAASRPARPLAA
eukprot:5333997-Prymnesium_polylepis.1